MLLRRSIPILAVSIVACDGPAPYPTEPPPPTAHARTQAFTGAPVEAFAAGAAHREAGGAPVLLNFSAKRFADGRVQGSYYYQSVFDHTWLLVDVTCITVVDDTAWVGGVIRDSSVPQVIGTVSYFYAFDNGEGSAADPDVVSLTRANDAAGEDLRFCEERPLLLPQREVLHGNVQVEG